MITYFLFFLGFVVLILGAKFLVDGASSMGIKAGLSQFIIGLTIVALGTSLPELIINVIASLNGKTDLAIGNVLGSNIMNILLILGITAIIYPVKVNKNICKRDTWINLISILLLGLLAKDTLFNKSNNTIDRLDGFILLSFFGIMIYILATSKNTNSDDNSKITTYPLYKSIVLIIAGGLGLFFGGDWIVKGATEISISFGISQSTLGLTLIAMATSLPELVTSIVAALKKNTDIAIGNVLGSNIFNIFLVLGASASITPIQYEGNLDTEIIILFLSSVFLMIVIRLGKTKLTITRAEGAILVSGYLLFLWLTVF